MFLSKEDLKEIFKFYLSFIIHYQKKHLFKKDLCDIINIINNENKLIQGEQKWLKEKIQEKKRRKPKSKKSKKSKSKK